jgi:photosystem I subunit VI
VSKLQDLTNTTGSWDMYGDDSPKRYPGLQDEFFQRAGEPFSRRETIRVFTAAGKCMLVMLRWWGHLLILWFVAVSLVAIATYGFKGAKDAKLPITLGPDASKTENGKGGKFNRL